MRFHRGLRAVRHQIVTWCYGSPVVLATRIRPLLVWLGAASLALSTSSQALANGAFPAVSQLVSDPSDAAHLVLRSNFGLLTTRDRGENWDIVCEAGVGYQNIEPAIALLSDGTTIAALSSGIAHGSRDECSFEIAPGLTSYIADVARDSSLASGAIAVSVDFDQSASQLWRSADDGSSWSELGEQLDNLNAATLDTTATGVLYVSGISQGDVVTGVLARSDDGGETFRRHDVPGASKVSAPYIAALDPGDPDTVYVRLSGTPGRLLVTRDGGSTFSALLEFDGPFDGFALSPDGRFALASGRADGVWRANTDDLVFERLSCAKVRCLSWSDAGLFACADEFQAGFLVGESTDQGQTFAPRLHMPCVRGLLECPASSSVGRMCGAEWPALSEKLGSDCTGACTFDPDTSCTADASPAGAAGETSAAGATSSGGAPAASSPRTSGGCSLAAPGSTQLAWLVGAGILLRAWARRRRGREVARGRC